MPSVTGAKSNTRVGGSRPEGDNRVASAAQEQETQRLIQACRSGDSAAWNALIHRYQPVLYRMAYSVCRHHEEAGDIVGEVLLHLYRNLSSYRAEGQFTRWLFRITRNCYVDLYVRSKHHSDLSLDTFPAGDSNYTDGYDIPDPAPSPERVCLEHATEQELAHAIRHLPANQRRVLTLYYPGIKSYQKISAEMGLPLGTVKSRLNRARHLLSERLEICAGR